MEHNNGCRHPILLDVSKLKILLMSIDLKEDLINGWWNIWALVLFFSVSVEFIESVLQRLER